MRDRDTFRRGSFYRIDDRTGFAVRTERTSKEWDGTIVAREDAEPRHPQDFVRARRDNMRVPDPRPEPADQFQAAQGGPFLLIEMDGFDTAIRIEDGTDETEIRIYRGSNQISASDL
jgi:hypothetical protein